MKEKIIRNYLEIKSLEKLSEVNNFTNNFNVELVLPADFQLNKFFYKNVGKNYHWLDRLIWSNNIWQKYVSNKNLFTYILKDKQNMAGFFELIYHQEKKEVEIAYLGILEKYQNKKLGSYLLSEAIKRSFKKSINRVWVHTCTLDHKNALKNYISRGMKIFKTETIKF